YFIAVFPANVHNALQGLNVQGLPASDWYYWVRLGFQPLAVWWALFCSGLIDWPRHHRPGSATGTADHYRVPWSGAGVQGLRAQRRNRAGAEVSKGVQSLQSVTSTMIISPDNPDPPHLEPDVSIFGSPRDRLAFYRREIHHEISNLSGRTNTFLTAQSFLVIAYASSMGNTNPDWGPLFTLVVPALLALFGIFSSISAWPGIRASC